MVTEGTVTFCFEGETDDDVQVMTERILEAVEKLCPDIPYSVTEDTWEEDGEKQSEEDPESG